MKSYTSTLALLLLSIFNDAAEASCAHLTRSQTRKLTINKRADGGESKTVQVSKFGYLGTQGPAGWAELAPENAPCSTSSNQSPIDITNTSTTLTNPGALTIEFPTVESAELENLGTTVELVMEGKNAKTTVGGAEFALKQLHFHSPSEHTINGEYFPLEMHMVHESADGGIAVITAQFQLSESNETTSLLTSVTEKIGEITTPGSITETGPLDFTPLVEEISRQSLHTYNGSLTTPPCTEGITFFVTSEQLPLDVATFNKLKAVLGFNARFSQNIPGQENLLSLASDTIVAEGGADAKGSASATAAPAQTLFLVALSLLMLHAVL